MKNNLKDLNNLLFAQLELLSDDEAMSDSDTLKREIGRNKAMSALACNIVNIASLQLEAIKVKETYALKDGELTELTQSKTGMIAYEK